MEPLLFILYTFKAIKVITVNTAFVALFGYFRVEIEIFDIRLLYLLFKSQRPTIKCLLNKALPGPKYIDICVS